MSRTSEVVRRLGGRARAWRESHTGVLEGVAASGVKWAFEVEHLP